ncbi:MAG: hypothetical protein QM613_04475 [Micrococcaceae bacterium]
MTLYIQVLPLNTVHTSTAFKLEEGGAKVVRICSDPIISNIAIYPPPIDLYYVVRSDGKIEKPKYKKNNINNTDEMLTEPPTVQIPKAKMQDCPAL